MLVREPAPILLAVPNFSEGRDATTIDTIARALGPAAREPARDALDDLQAVRLLDVHSDRDHHRSVFTLAGSPGRLAQALLAGARAAVRRIDLREPRGVHPHIGAVDVVPIVHLEALARGAACAEALVAGSLIAQELDVPVFLYGVLGRGRTRAELRRGGREGLAARLLAGELCADIGPDRLHPSAGGVLLAARPPLVAFNLELAPPATLTTAMAIAAAIREGGAEGLPGVRAIGLVLADRASRAQVSINVEDPQRVSLADVVAAVRRHAPVACAELVGLAPRVAFEGFPEDVPVPGFDPGLHLIENALARVTS